MTDTANRHYTLRQICNDALAEQQNTYITAAKYRAILSQFMLNNTYNLSALFKHLLLTVPLGSIQLQEADDAPNTYNYMKFRYSDITGNPTSDMTMANQETISYVEILSKAASALQQAVSYTVAEDKSILDSDPLFNELYNFICVNTTSSTISMLFDIKIYTNVCTIAI